MAATRTKGPKVPSYSLHKARGLACCKVGGKRIYLGKYGSPESREAYARVVASVLAGAPVTADTVKTTGAKPAATITVAMLAEKYLEHCAAYYRRNGEPTEQLIYARIAVERLVDRFGEVPAHEFGPLAFTAYRDGLVAMGLSRRYINATCQRVRRMFRWGGSLEIIPATVAQSLALVEGLKQGRTDAREPGPVRPVDDAVVDATIRELPEVVADMVRFQRLTGARPGEVCKLRPCDLDRTGDVWTYRPASHKTQHHGKSRTVFIGPQGQAVLLKYLARAADTYCFRPCDSEAKRRAAQHAARTTPLSCGNRPGTNTKPSPLRTAGDRYTKDSYARAIARAAKRAKVEKWTPNQLRHTYATAVRRDHGLEATQILLGHSGAKVTEIYAERDMAKGAAVARLIG
ncbi:site-specific integrase [Botrimarina sp.]|uniref:tyrosine-type recombinase/integrase n=1 Tax=Botrimarina sp. TaxID=2795802 RepID=UPI0032EC2F1B